MQRKIKTLLKFFTLVIILNIIRYVAGFPIEKLFLPKTLFAAMERNSSYFNTNFTTFDWVTSYFYNFMMWLTCTWVFILLQPVLRGNDIMKSLKVFGLMYLFFASISAIYMNHYSHPKDFYLYSMSDGLIVFAIVAIANGLIYPRIFKDGA